MQDPNADTEWNDILRAKGILPPKASKEVALDEDTVVQVRPKQYAPHSVPRYVEHKHVSLLVASNLKFGDHQGGHKVA